LPTSATILTHEAVSLEQHENDSGLPSGNARLVSEIVDMDLLAMRHLLERDGDARRLLHVGILAAEKVRLHATVFDAIQHRARRGLAIASSAPGLLIVRLDASRKVIVNDEADVALVDAEAKCVRGNHRFEAIGHESVLHVLAVGGRHLPVVQTNGHVAAELLVEPLRFTYRRDVHDADAGTVAEQTGERRILLALIHRAAHLEAQIRSREAGDRN